MIVKKLPKNCFDNTFLNSVLKKEENEKSYITFVMLKINNNFNNYYYLSEKLIEISRYNLSSLEIIFISKKCFIFVLRNLNTDESYRVLMNITNDLNDHYKDNNFMELKISMSALNIERNELYKKKFLPNINLYTHIFKILKKNIKNDNNLVIVNKYYHPH